MVKCEMYYTLNNVLLMASRQFDIRPIGKGWLTGGLFSFFLYLFISEFCCDANI